MRSAYPTRRASIAATVRLRRALERRRLVLADEVEHRGFDLRPRGLVCELGRTPEVFERGRDGPAGAVAIDHARVDVGRAAHRRGVAEQGRDRFDGCADRALAPGLRVGYLPTRQRHSREHRRVPGAEVLGRMLARGCGLDVLVDVVGAHVHPSPAVAVGQQLAPAAAPALERPDDLAYGRIADLLDAALPALGLVVEDR